MASLHATRSEQAAARKVKGRTALGAMRRQRSALYDGFAGAADIERLQVSQSAMIVRRC